MTPLDPLSPLHGGPDAHGTVRHDFSTNGNACGPCPHAAAAIEAVDATRYPDPRYTALRERLGAFHGVGGARIVIAASASEFISRITAAVRQSGGHAVWLPRHRNGDCQRAAECWGFAVHREPAPASGASLVWCCDPSSPLGQPMPGLPALIGGLDRHSTCVLDLAYEPLRLEGRLPLTVEHTDRVWQLWTPNKAMGLTGVRAAYAIAPRDDAAGLAAQLDRLAPSWPVGAHGVALLAAWTELETQDWLRECLDRLRSWKEAQRSLCESLGWTCLPSVANFFCARPDGPCTPRAEVLRAAGIRLRDTASFGLPGHVRLTVLPPESQAALRNAWNARPFAAGAPHPGAEPAR